MKLVIVKLVKYSNVQKRSLKRWIERYNDLGNIKRQNQMKFDFIKSKSKAFCLDKIENQIK